VTWNQDNSCLAVGTDKGVAVVEIDPCRERFKREFNQSVVLVEPLFKTNILALVGNSDKWPSSKVFLWDDAQGQSIAELEFAEPVKGMRMRKDRLVVVLEKRLFVYNFSDVKLVDQFETFSNPTGLVSMAPNTDQIVIASLGEKPGQVRIEHYSRHESYLIDAHTNAISQMALSPDGSKLATTSTRGTLVRVFDIQTKQKLHEFRRGSTTAAIHSLSFSKDSSLLCVSSDRGTVHVYNLNVITENRTSSFSFMSSMVPFLGSSWSSKQLSVNETKSLCLLHDDYIYVFGASGKLYKFSITSPDKPISVEDFIEKSIAKPVQSEST